jgi:type I site-specific restriction endonuclease
MPLKLSEKRTRKEMIDPQQERAGWVLHYRSTKNLDGIVYFKDRNNYVPSHSRR